MSRMLHEGVSPFKEKQVYPPSSSPSKNLSCLALQALWGQVERETTLPTGLFLISEQNSVDQGKLRESPKGIAPILLASPHLLRPLLW